MLEQVPDFDEEGGVIPPVSEFTPRSLDVVAKARPEQVTALDVWKPRKFVDLMDEVGLGWTVSKEQLFDAKGEKWVDSFGIRRDDNGDQLGRVGPQYTPFQNIEMAKILDEVCATIEGGMPIELDKVVSLRGGSRINLMARLPEAMNLKLYNGKDVHQPFIIVRSSHDSSHAIEAFTFVVRQICTNGMVARDPKSVRGVMKLRHTAHAKTRAQEAATLFSTVGASLRDYNEKMSRLSEIKVNSTQRWEAVQTIVEPDKKKRDKAGGSFRKKVNAIVDLIEMNDGTFGVAEVKDSAYGILQAVTAFSNHYQPARGSIEQQASRRLERVLSRDDMSARATEVLLAM